MFLHRLQEITRFTVFSLEVEVEEGTLLGEEEEVGIRLNLKLC